MGTQSGPALLNESAKPRVGVSACLLGQLVRFDGGHKADAFVKSVLGRFVDLVPVCPEVESGMSVPRETLRLVGATRDTARVIGNRSGTDHTVSLSAWAQNRADELAASNLDGFVLKKDSPSCGMDRVKLYPDVAGTNAVPTRDGVGVFAAALSKRMPHLPLTEEGRLCDAMLRESFLARVYAHHRIRQELLPNPSRAKILEFHAAHKLLLMAHSPAHYRELGKLVAAVSSRPLSLTVNLYAAGAMAALAQPATTGRHANVLEHVLGYFKKVLSADEKAEVLQTIEAYRLGLHGLVVPMTLLAHHLRKHEQDPWLAKQVYFQPYPRSLDVRGNDATLRPSWPTPMRNVFVDRLA